MTEQQSKRKRDMKKYGNPIAKNMNKVNRPKTHENIKDYKRRKINLKDYGEYDG